MEIIQGEGPSFAVDEHEIRWQKWHFRIGFTPREGLVLYAVGSEDQGKIQPILYRASLSDMLVPYGDPSEASFRKNAFDIGEYGMGELANSLTLGCDCLGDIHCFDASMTAGTSPMKLTGLQRGAWMLSRRLWRSWPAMPKSIAGLRALN